MPANLTMAVPAASVSRPSGDQRLVNHVAATVNGASVVADGDQVVPAGIVIGTPGNYLIFTGALWSVATTIYGAGWWKNGTIQYRVTTTPSTDRMGNFITGPVALVAGDVVALNTYQNGSARTLLTTDNQTYIAAVRLT